MTSGELGREHEYLLETITDEDVVEYRESFQRLFPDQAHYMDMQSDEKLRNDLARVAWLASILDKKG